MHSNPKNSPINRLLRVALSVCIWAGITSVIFAQRPNDKPDVNTLIKTISRGDTEDRLSAFDDLESLNWSGKATPAIPAIQACLTDANGMIRIQAAKLLLEMDQPQERLEAVVITGLQDKDAEVRSSAVYLLYRFDCEYYHRLVDHAVVALTDSKNDIRRMASGFLGEAGPDFKAKSIPGLTKLLDDPNDLVRMEAAAALIAVDGPLKKAMPVLINIIKEANDQAGKFAVFGLASQTIEAIGEIGPDAISAVPELTNSLELGGTYRQSAASEAMAKIKPKSDTAIKGLEKALLNGNVEGMPFVHRSWCASDEAAKALVAAGEDSIPILLNALSFKDDRVRANAAVALGSFPSAASESVPKLIELMKDESPSVRANAAWALGLLGPPAKPALKPLVDLLFDDSEWDSAPAGGGIATSYSVPWHAVEAIKRIEFASENNSGKPDVTEFTESIKSGLKKHKTINFAAATVIAKYALALNDDGEKSVREQLTPLVEKLLDHEKFGSEAAYALASFHPTHPRVQSVLESSLIIKATDGSDVVDLVAVQGLELLGFSGNDSVRASLQSAIPKLETAIDLNEDDYADDSIYCSLAILSIDPKNEKAIDSLLTGIRNSFWERDEQPVEMAFKRIPAIVATSSYLENKLFEQLNAREVSIDWDTSPKVSELFKFEIHLQAAKMLVSANLARAETTATLIELCEKGRGFDLVETQMVLAKIRPTSPAAVEAIAKSLSDFSNYSMGGDFRGNGGISYTPSEKAAEALVKIGAPALDLLIKKTSDPFHLVRAQAVKAISSIQSPSAKSEAITKRLIELATDVSHRVRLEAVTALSEKEVVRIKMAKRKGTDPTPNASILAVLKKASQDQRPTICAAAEQGLSAIQLR